MWVCVCRRAQSPVNLFTKLYVIFILQWIASYLVGMKRKTSRCFTCKRDNSHFLRYLKNPSIMPLGVFLVLK